MKKIIFFTLFVLMISSIFAFEVLDSNDEARIYFSTSNDNVKVRTDLNATILTVEYEGSSTRSQIYPFGACGSAKCATFDLTDLVDSNSDSTDSTIEFSLEVNGSIQKIYLDVENPVFNLTKAQADTVNKEIDFEFTYQDDQGIEIVELYEKEGSSETLIANLTGNSYTFTGVSKSIYEFVFKVEDKAGNVQEATQTVNVGDLSNPVISEAVLIKQDDDSFELELELSDNEGLDRYELSQGSINLNEDISGTSYSKSIKTPFSSGTVILTVYDNKGNSATKSLDLNTKISNSYGSKFSDSKYFKITSNADKCVLDEVDGDSENDEFEKDDDEFEVRLDVDSNEEVEVKFYCQKSGFRQFFERDFFYDNENPTNTNLSITKTSDGYLKLSWDEASDEQSDVDYILYRDDDKIYSGSRLEYVDQKVIYPNEYVYYLKVEDEAGNDVETKEVSEVPNKVKVLFELDENFETKVQESKYNLVFETEKNVDAIVRIENNGQEIANYKFKTTSENVNLNFELVRGQNVIYLDLEDSFGNINSQDFYVIYEPEVLVEPQPAKEVVQEVIAKPKEKIIEAVDNIPEEIKEDTKEAVYSKWLWFAIILAAFAYFIWYFVINEDALRVKDRYRARKNRTALDKKKKIDSSFFVAKRGKDDVLAKDFNRIKKERIKRQETRKLEEFKKKKLEEKQKARTELERKKLEDLANSKKEEISIPLSQRVKAKRRVNKVKKEVDYVDELASSKSRIEKPKKKFSFFSKKEPEKEPSEMDNYLARTTQNKGWGSSSEYVVKPKPIIKEEPKDDLTELKSKKELEAQSEVQEKKGWFSRFRKSNEIKDERVVDGDEISQEEVQKTIEESEPVKEEVIDRKVHLDDYLNNITKKKKRKSFYFAEKKVSRDLNDRK